MLTLTSYIDESRHEQSDDHMVVAGFCGSENQWKSFLIEWQRALDKKYALHMKDLRWSGEKGERRTKALLARLGPVPYRHGLCPVYGAVKVSDYFDLIEGDPEFEQKICGYILCLAVVLSVLVRDLPGHVKVKIICDKQYQYEPLARELFKSFREMVAKSPKNAYFEDIDFITRDSLALTQPADYLAFALTKVLDEKGSKKELWCRPIFNGKEPSKIPGRLYTRDKARRSILEIKNGVKERRTWKFAF